MIIHKKPASQLWDRCAPLMFHCFQHPISEHRITDGWPAPLVMLSPKQCPGQLCFERKMRYMQASYFALMFSRVVFKFQEYLQRKNIPLGGLHNRVTATELWTFLNYQLWNKNLGFFNGMYNNRIIEFFLDWKMVYRIIRYTDMQLLATDFVTAVHHEKRIFIVPFLISLLQFSLHAPLMIPPVPPFILEVPMSRCNSSQTSQVLRANQWLKILSMSSDCFFCRQVAQT